MCVLKYAEWKERGESNGKVRADKKIKDKIWEFVFVHAFHLWKRGWGFFMVFNNASLIWHF